MTRPLGVAALVLAVLVSAAHAEPVQITIAPPAEATTMDPGRSTQVLTVNYFVNLYDTLTRWDAALTAASRRRHGHGGGSTDDGSIQGEPVGASNVGIREPVVRRGAESRRDQHDSHGQQ